MQIYVHTYVCGTTAPLKVNAVSQVRMWIVGAEWCVCVCVFLPLHDRWCPVARRSACTAGSVCSTRNKAFATWCKLMWLPCPVLAPLWPACWLHTYSECVYTYVFEYIMYETYSRGDTHTIYIYIYIYVYTVYAYCTYVCSLNECWGEGFSAGSGVVL